MATEVVQIDEPIMANMTSDVSLGELIQRLHSLGSSPQPAVSPSGSLRTSLSHSSSVSSFHIHPTFSPTLLSTVTARAGLPPLTPPTPSTHSEPSATAIRQLQSDRFVKALLARHERSIAATTAKSSTATQSPDSSTPATPAAGTPFVSDASVLSPPSSSSAAAGRALLHSLILRYTGSALPQKRTRSPIRSSSSRKPSPQTKSTGTQVRPASAEQPPTSSPSSSSPSLTVPPPSSSSSASSSSASRHHRQLFTRSSSSITPVSVSFSASSTSTSSTSSSQSTPSRPKRSSSTSGSTARQRASIEVEKAQLKAAAEAARIAARATTMAASLLINATGSRLAEESRSHSQLSIVEDGKGRKRERLSGASESVQPGAHELLHLSSAGDNLSLNKQRDTSGLQQPKRRKAEKPRLSQSKTAARAGRPGRKRKEAGEDGGARPSKRRPVTSAAARTSHAQAAVAAAEAAAEDEQADGTEYSVVRNGDTSGDSADDDTDGSSGRSYDSYDSEVESNNEHSSTLLPLKKADSRGASLLAASRSSSFASRLSTPLMASGLLVSSASFGLPVLSSGPTPLARTSSRGRVRGSPLLN